MISTWKHQGARCSSQSALIFIQWTQEIKFELNKFFLPKSAWRISFCGFYLGIFIEHFMKYLEGLFTKQSDDNLGWYPVRRSWSSACCIGPRGNNLSVKVTLVSSTLHPPCNYQLRASVSECISEKCPSEHWLRGLCHSYLSSLSYENLWKNR